MNSGQYLCGWRGVGYWWWHLKYKLLKTDLKHKSLNQLYKHLYKFELYW